MFRAVRGPLTDTIHDVTDAPTVHAIIPLSLLEALRNLDTPVEDGLEELAGEIVSKRLGLSPTVAAQIARYQQTVRGSGRVDVEEALAVFRLAGRRPDAALVFADAGRRAARLGARQAPVILRGLRGLMPGGLGRRVGRRLAARTARAILGAELGSGPGGAEGRVPMSLAIRALPEGQGCGFYGAAFGELLRVLTGFEGAMVHDRCRGRGGDSCHWRAASGGEY
jgi:hypothetical protein